MKQVFLDKNKMVVIKIFKSKQDLDKEIYGVKNLGKFIKVPKIEKLDSKVAKIELLNGFLGYQIPEGELEVMVAFYLQSLVPLEITQKYSIMEELSVLNEFFQDNPNLKNLVLKIKNQVRNLEFVPVHGDLQKQNIIVAQGELGLIDFEHFIFAPKEMELVNSLFFKDGNCLNVKNILTLLPPGFINKKVLKSMLHFYTLKQIKLGMSKQGALLKLNNALKNVDNLKIGKNNTRSLGMLRALCYL